MSMFADVRSRISGQLSRATEAGELRRRGDELLLQLVDRAIARWTSGPLPGAGVDENGHNVILAKCMHEVRSRDSRFQWQRINPELPALTPAMLAGTAPPSGAKRPDISVAANVDDAGWSVECKKLQHTPQSRQYVTEGMSRFADGQYSPKRALGAMVGYVYAATAADRVREVNTVVPVLPGPATPLAPHPPLSTGGRLSRAASTHPRAPSAPDLRLEHFLLKCD